jgi:uncharacterized membrane protein
MPLVKHFKGKFITGLLSSFLLVTLYVVYLIVSFLDAIASPLFDNITRSLIGRSLYIPGLGLLLFVIITYVAGVFTSNYAGRKLVAWGEALLRRIPFIKSIYASTKDFIEAFSSEKLKSFREVVLIEFPHKGSYALGFVTGRVQHEDAVFCAVFVPTTPNPTSGYLVLVPTELRHVAIPVDEAIKYVSLSEPQGGSAMERAEIVFCLEALRKVLLRALIVVGAVDSLSFFFPKAGASSCPGNTGEGLLFFCLKPFFATVELAIYVGIFVSVPIIGVIAWREFRPLLERRQIRGHLFVASAILLFTLAAFFVWTVVLPSGISFLLSYQGGVVKAMISIKRLILFCAAMMFASRVRLNYR